ncbi:SANT/Myb domain-containing protein [Dioscorea alata]|uniref:SANT/Myb domain-containing protein n=1 Tax=Dioscorea alata TaxID=55571 RepID=A0ACB7UWT3_DIOAL|nr:SANT/Myb domain-containing protein [Dioscorea alata]
MEEKKRKKKKKKDDEIVRSMDSAHGDMGYSSEKVVEEDYGKSEKKKKSKKKNQKESGGLEDNGVTNKETVDMGESENGLDLDGSEVKSGENRKEKKRKKLDPMANSDFGEKLDYEGRINENEMELVSEKLSTSSSSKETMKEVMDKKKRKDKSSKLVSSASLDTAAKATDSLGSEECEDLSGNKSERKRRRDADTVEAEKHGNSKKKKVKQASRIVAPSVTKDDIGGTPSMANENGEKSNDMKVKNSGTEHVDKSKSKKGAKNKAAKKESKSKKRGIDDLKTSASKQKKKVSFSGDVEVFPVKNATNCEEEDEENMIRGKRYTQEEDELLKKAVLDYVEENGLGEDGVEKVMDCRKYPEVKNCWKIIRTALPRRPYCSVYTRAHVIFQRSERRNWLPEEVEYVKKFHEEHGPDWATLAKILGKHRFHVKDTWRRVKLPAAKKGKWSQDEYQTLFDLVNMDLRMKAFTERKPNHKILRDNIAWDPIGEKLKTRHDALCCMKWYNQLTSPLVNEGLWVDSDDYRLIYALQNEDACCEEDVDWDNLLEHRPGDICRKRWNQMIRYIGGHREKSFIEQVEVLSQRYCPEMLEYRE